jgi:putative aldouronate transport system substrate-binding protein
MRKIKAMMGLLAGVMLVAVFMAGCTTASSPAATTQATQATVAADQTTAAADQTTAAATQAPEVNANPFKDPMEISIATWDIDKTVAGGDSDAVLQAFYKKFNITVKAVNLTWDDYTDKVNMWASSGQLPDLFTAVKAGTPVYKQWAQQGVIHALPDDMSAYPNLSKILSSPDIQALKVDGKLYCVPRVSYTKPGDWEQDRAVLYRWDWAKQLGITKEPTTWDDFTALLTAYTKSNPDGKGAPIGLTARNSTYLEALMLAWNPAVVDDGSGMNNWIKEDDKWIPAFASKAELPGLKAIKSWYTSGLIDKDFALIKGTEGDDKFVSGQAGALIYSGAPTHINQIVTLEWSKTNTDKNFYDCVKVWKVPASPDGKSYHFTYQTYWSEAYINSTVKDDKLARILYLADYLFSDEGSAMCHYGIKDTDYTVDANGKVTMKDPSVSLVTKYPALNSFPYLFSWSQFVADQLVSPAFTDDLKAYCKANYDWYDANTIDTPVNFQVNAISTDAKDKLVMKHTDDFTRLITSSGNLDSEYADTLNGYNDKGLQTAETEMTAAAAKLGQ